MGRSSKMQNLRHFAISMGSKRNFQLQRLHNRMRWFKERTEWFKTWREWCFSTETFHRNSRLKRWALHVTLGIGFSSEQEQRRHHTKFGGKRSLRVKYFHVFGSKCYILNDRENLGKFDAKSDEGIFLGYSTNSRAYRAYNKRTKTVMESINIVIDDTISEKDVDEDGEGPTLKKNEGDDNMP